MLRTIEHNVIQLHDTEAQILKCKQLKHQIDVLQAEYDRTKKTLIDGHFSTHEEFVGSEGLILATYKGQVRSQFMGSEFKKDHPILHNEYSVNVPMKVFLIKK